jgi:CRP/FNR family transcriptional regulator, cyclic AMP receptor protein
MQPAEVRMLLRRVRILAGLDDADLNVVVAATTWRRVNAGDEVISHLDCGNEIFLVIEGVLGARIETAFGRQVAIRRLPAGCHFGEIAALTRAPRSLGVTAETDALLGECSADAFLNLMARNSAFATAVARHLARTVVSLTDRVFELSALEVRFRIYAELLRLASAGEGTKEGILIRNTPTHAAIAASVGAQREAVTRELRALAREGVLRQTKREILILDVDALRRLVRHRAGYTASDRTEGSPI